MWVKRGRLERGSLRGRLVSVLIMRWAAVRWLRAEMTWGALNAGFRGTFDVIRWRLQLGKVRSTRNCQRASEYFELLHPLMLIPVHLDIPVQSDSYKDCSQLEQSICQL